MRSAKQKTVWITGMKASTRASGTLANGAIAPNTRHSRMMRPNANWRSRALAGVFAITIGKSERELWTDSGAALASIKRTNPDSEHRPGARRRPKRRSLRSDKRRNGQRERPEPKSLPRMKSAAFGGQGYRGLSRWGT